MTILGTHLSAVTTTKPKKIQSSTPATSEDEVRCLSQRTILGILVSKMILMPMVGIGTVWMYKTWFWNVPTRKDNNFQMQQSCFNVFCLVETSYLYLFFGFSYALVI
jgi:hypothetical protein